MIGVGAINARGNKASFSNHGSCVDIYAPGANIYTATNEGDDQLKKLSGTSFSTPFVSGKYKYYQPIFNNIPFYMVQH